MKANPPQPTQRANQRHILSRADKEKLMVIFESGNRYPTLELRSSLAEELGITQIQVSYIR